ncbi:NADH dehydrogenase FAD-containing subunit [Coprothermobacteraceae bacterium]|nr:NADH dehydrogenase FAD-containing subunit [Coprothermobacteraceae bacterium]
MRDIFQIIAERRSVRSFKPDQIPEDILRKILDAALWAPTAGNLQARKFFVVRNAEMRRLLAEAAHGQDFVGQAPVVVVACSDLEAMKSAYGVRGKNLYSICDVSAAVQNLMLAAWAEGIGSCWIGSFEEQQVKELLRLPDHLQPIALVPLGYPDEKPATPRRKTWSAQIQFID